MGDRRLSQAMTRGVTVGKRWYPLLGSDLTAAPGDHLDPQLEENPTTGLRWYVEDDKSGVLACCEIG